MTNQFSAQLYYEVGGKHFVVGDKIASCRHILTGLHTHEITSYEDYNGYTDYLITFKSELTPSNNLLSFSGLQKTRATLNVVQRNCLVKESSR